MSKAFAAAPWYAKIGYVLAWIFVFPPVILLLLLVVLLLVGPVYVFAIGHNYISQRRFSARMRRQGRFLRDGELRRRIASESGTLIVESPSYTWKFTLAWWTPEDALAKSPCIPPKPEEYKLVVKHSGKQYHEWDLWCWKNYINPDSGSAFLVRARNGNALKAKLARSFPQLKTVQTWSAFVPKRQPSLDVADDART